MKRSVFILSLVFLGLFSHAQKVEYNKKTKEVEVDGQFSFSIEKTGCGFDPQCYYDIFDKDGNKIIKLVYKSFKSPVEVSSSNPEGMVRYYQYIFLESGRKAENGFIFWKEKKLAALMVEFNLIKDGKLNEEGVKEFIMVNGNEYSERVKF
jgi:hypothetical protein